MRPAEGDEPDPQEATHALLDDLRTRRGVRQTIDEDDDGEEFEGFGPPHAFDFAARRVRGPRRAPGRRRPRGRGARAGTGRRRPRARGAA